MFHNSSFVFFFSFIVFFSSSQNLYISKRFSVAQEQLITLLPPKVLLYWEVISLGMLKHAYGNLLVTPRSSWPPNPFSQPRKLRHRQPKNFSRHHTPGPSRTCFFLPWKHRLVYLERMELCNWKIAVNEDEFGLQEFCLPNPCSKYHIVIKKLTLKIACTTLCTEKPAIYTAEQITENSKRGVEKYLHFQGLSVNWRSTSH